MRTSTPAFGSFHQTNSAGMNYSLRIYVIATQPKKRWLHFNERNCFSLELKAEIINAVDMKRKTKVQIYRDYKYNIKMFVWKA